MKGTPTVMKTCTSYPFVIFSAEHRILSCDVLPHVYHLRRLSLHRHSRAPMSALLLSTLPCVLPGLQHPPEYWTVCISRSYMSYCKDDRVGMGD